MSRIGKLPVNIPSGVEVTVEGLDIHVKGPKGELSLRLHEGISASVVEDKVRLVPEAGGEAQLSSFHGLDRALLQNCVIGVHVGYKKELEIVGTGFMAKLVGGRIELQIGFSHPVTIDVPSDLEVEVPEPTKITISGTDKQRVGHMAAVVRKLRPPEPYKGKGIRYKGEKVKIKPGKTLGAGGA